MHGAFSAAAERLAWRGTIYDRACVANLADHANLLQRSNEERTELVRVAANAPEMAPENRNNTHVKNNNSRDRYVGHADIGSL